MYARGIVTWGSRQEEGRAPGSGDLAAENGGGSSMCKQVVCA